MGSRRRERALELLREALSAWEWSEEHRKFALRYGWMPQEIGELIEGLDREARVKVRRAVYKANRYAGFGHRESARRARRICLTKDATEFCYKVERGLAEVILVRTHVDEYAEHDSDYPPEVE